MKTLVTRSILAFGAVAAALLFTVGVQAQSTYDPYFNTFTGVSGVGNEADFLRIRQADGTKVDTVEACSGEVTVWMYVHNNSPSQNNDNPATPGNLDGVGVAKNTRVKVAIPSGTSNSHTLKGTISADNARATVTDTTKITCGGKAVKLEYIGTDPVYTTAPGGYTLKGDITSANGAQLGYNGGVLPGCWEYRAWITLKVRIVPEVPKVQTLTCDNLSVVSLGDRKIKATVKGSATNGASITSYTIDFGDGTKVNQQTAEHTYTSDGTKTISSSVTGKLDGKDKTVTSKNCVKQVTFKPGTPPVIPPETPETPPTEIPNTGTGSLVGIFAAVTALGAAGHRFWMIRKSNR